MDFESFAEREKDNVEVKRLISLLAHDLRSPIFNVMGFANLLEQLWQNETNPDIKFYIHLIRKEAENSLQLINSFADRCSEIQSDFNRDEKILFEDILNQSKRERQKSLVEI
jgi:signal transduction histidine kinase